MVSDRPKNHKKTQQIRNQKPRYNQMVCMERNSLASNAMKTFDVKVISIKRNLMLVSVDFSNTRLNIICFSHKFSLSMTIKMYYFYFLIFTMLKRSLSGWEPKNSIEDPRGNADFSLSLCTWIFSWNLKITTRTNFSRFGSNINILYRFDESHGHWCAARLICLDLYQIDSCDFISQNRFWTSTQYRFGLHCRINMHKSSVICGFDIYTVFPFIEWLEPKKSTNSKLKHSQTITARR